MRAALPAGAMPTCRACGASAPDDARFCPTCGSTLQAAPLPAAPLPSWQLPQAPAPPPPLPGYGAPAPLPGPAAPARPLGVTIVSLWDLVVGALLAVVGLVVMAMGPALMSDPGFRAQFQREIASQLPPGWTPDMMLGALGAFVLLYGLAMVAVGYGMWHARPWSWTGILALVVVGILVNVLTFPAGLVGVILNALLLWYFTRPGVKQWFGKAAPEDFGMPGYVPPPAPPPPGPPS